ncbi:MAG: hypothetical protein U9N44_03030 [Chloroflexota bacterium]|nr:hypothetical protein [Chloroflexota bacterium]
MVKETNFEIGQTYTNRKGTYKVVAIDGNVMHISWKDGQEVATTVTLQSRILKHIQLELEEPTVTKAVSPRKRASAAVSI